VFQVNNFLERFSLQGSTIDFAAADELAVLLATNRTLIEVDITDCDVSEERMCNIAAMVNAVGGTLGDLHYDGKNLINDDRVLQINLKISVNRSYVILNIIVPKDVAILSKMLQGAQLKGLNLGYSFIKDVGCKILLNALNSARISFIQSIDLHNCSLMSGSADLIVSIVENCGTTKLFISGNSIQHTAAVFIKQTELEQSD